MTRKGPRFRSGIGPDDTVAAPRRALVRNDEGPARTRTLPAPSRLPDGSGPQPRKSPHFGGGSVPQGISGTVEVEFLGEPCTTLSE